MAYKSILTILTDPDEVAGVLNAAAPFAAAHGAHLDVLCLGIDRSQMGYYYAGATAMIHEEMFAYSEQEAAKIEQAARDVLAKHEATWAVEAIVVPGPSLISVVASRARFADLVFLSKPYGPDKPSDAPMVAETALFHAQAPIIVMPDGMEMPTRPERIVAAWNDSAEAMVAIRRALPLLVSAKQVSVCIVAPSRHSDSSADPGAEISKMLTRHGAKVEVTILPQTLTRVSEVIARHVSDIDADMLVMGAYGHSRFREAILGGATRNMLEHSAVPVFLAH